MRRAVWIGGVVFGVVLAGSVANGAPETLDSFAVAVPPSEPNRVVVFSNDPGDKVWVTTSLDGGATWGPPVGPARTDKPRFPDHAAVLAGGALLVKSEGWVYRSVDGGITWNPTLKRRISSIDP
jgi:hypothetical protein